MAVIYLIRHGQASFAKENYDQLSDLGIKQSVVLGEALKTRNSDPSLIVGGSMKRHHDTFRHCIQIHGTPVGYKEDIRFNEYNYSELIAKHNPKLNSFEELVKYISSQEQPMRALQQLLNDAIQDWMQETHEYAVSWRQFRLRAWGALNNFSSVLSKQDQVWVFTSGGVIASIILNLLELRDSQFMELQARIVNTSITKIMVGSRGLSLGTYNESGHLEHNASLMTYR